MLEIRELIRRVQLGETDRQIARDLHVSRKTVRKISRMGTGARRAQLSAARRGDVTGAAEGDTANEFTAAAAVESRPVPRSGDRAAPARRGMSGDL